MSTQPPFDPNSSSPYQPPQPEVYMGQPAAPPQTSGKALWSMILGILSFFLCAIAGVPAIILGFIGLNEVNRSQGRLTGSGMATSGIVMGFLSFLTGCGMVIPILLLLPAINAAREAARRNGCMSNVRQICIAAANHEAATRRFPLVNDSPYDLQTIIPGQASGAAGDDGYSYLVKLLPYMEEAMLFNEIKQSSENFQQPAFDSSLTAGASHPAVKQIPYFRCPSYHGESTCRSDADYHFPDVAVGNYVATTATDFAPGRLNPAGPAAWKVHYPTWENGVIVSKVATGEPDNFRGISMRDITDGISQTVIVTESAEQRYASWFSGGSTWVVAVTAQSSRGEPNFGLTESGGQVEARGPVLTLNWGNVDEYRGGFGNIYLKAGQNWAASQDRVFGPSSDHSGNVMIHGFADAHAIPVSEDIDPTVYLRLITRSSGEAAPTVHDL